MGVESTRRIAREEAIEMIQVRLPALDDAFKGLTNAELENVLYALTRETHYFNNFRIEETS